MKKFILVSFTVLFLLCLAGIVVILLLVPAAPPAPVTVVNNALPPEPARLERDKIIIVFRSLGFDDWQAVHNYRQSTNGQAKIILYDNPVTKASLVLGYGVSDGGHLINKLLSTTDTDPSAMDWITAHLDGGGQTTIGKTDITVTDDTEAGRVIIELALAP